MKTVSGCYTRILQLLLVRFPSWDPHNTRRGGCAWLFRIAGFAVLFKASAVTICFVEPELQVSLSSRSSSSVGVLYVVSWRPGDLHQVKFIAMSSLLSSTHPTCAGEGDKGWWEKSNEWKPIEAIYLCILALNLAALETKVIDISSFEPLLGDSLVDTAIRVVSASEIFPHGRSSCSSSSLRALPDPGSQRWNDDKRKIHELLVQMCQQRRSQSISTQFTNTRGPAIRHFTQENDGPWNPLQLGVHNKIVRMDPSKDHSVTSTGTLSGTRWPKPTTTGDSDSGIHSRESQSETLFSPAASVGATPPQPRSVRTRRRSTSSANEIPKPGKRARGPQKHFCECGRDFPYVSKLRDHQKAHEVVKNIKCDYCTKVFKREREVTAHVKSVHKNIVSDPSMSISTQSSPLTYRHRPTSSVPEIATPSSQQSEGRTQGITPTSIIDDPPTQPSINEDPPGKIEINHPKSEHLTPKLEHITDSTEVPKVVVLETADDTEAKKDDHDNLSGPSNITNRSPQSPQSPLSPLSPNPKPQTPVPTPSFSTVQNLPTIETRMRYPTIELPENPNTPPSSGEESTKSETRSQISTSNDSPGIRQRSNSSEDIDVYNTTVLFGCGDSMNRKEDY